jgi:RND superfamily putative drug exporter
MATTTQNPTTESARHRMIALPSGRRTKFLVLLLWLLLASAAGPLAIGLTEAQDNDSLGALPGGAEAAAAAARAETAFPGSDRLIAVAVYAREAGLTQSDLTKVEADRAAFARHADGGQVSPATPSEDGKAQLISFAMAGDDDAQTAATDEDAPMDVKWRGTRSRRGERCRPRGRRIA